jgi:hypothetical protein
MRSRLQSRFLQVTTAQNDLRHHATLYVHTGFQEIRARPQLSIQCPLDRKRLYRDVSMRRASSRDKARIILSKGSLYSDHRTFGRIIRRSKPEFSNMRNHSRAFHAPADANPNVLSKSSSQAFRDCNSSCCLGGHGDYIDCTHLCPQAASAWFSHQSGHGPLQCSR